MPFNYDDLFGNATASYVPPRAAQPNPAFAYGQVGQRVATPTAPAAAGRSGWQQTNDFISSPAGGALITAGLGGLGTYLQARQATQARESAEAESEQDRMARAAEVLAANRTRRAESALRPLGEGAGFAATQARRTAVADLLGRGPMMPGNQQIASRMGSMPQVSPEALARLRAASSAESTAAGLAQRDMDIGNINPLSQGTDIASLTGLRPESPFLSDLLAQRQRVQLTSQQGLDESESYARGLLRDAIDMPSLAQPRGAAGAATGFPQRDPRQRPYGAY
jgi:hypothetical protein